MTRAEPTELKKKASAGISGKTSKDLSWHLFNRPILTSGINMDDPTEFAERFHRLILHGLSFQDDR